MNADDKDERIRQRAHLIWESEGRPDDRDTVHWEIAQRIIEEEDRQSSGEENLLDEAVEDSFPASDPPALTQPNTGIANDPHPENAARQTSSGRRVNRRR